MNRQDPCQSAESLEDRCREMRKDILCALTKAGSGHPGGSLSCVEILCALYLGGVMKYSPGDATSEDRDRFILSKGHAAPTLYTVLSYAGYFPHEELLSLRSLGSRLQGHPDSGILPGIEVSTGSLGQGFSVACGLSCGLKMKGSDASVFVLLGDGECEEGIVWEAAMFASHKKLDNLIAIVDFNELQIDGLVSDVAGMIDIPGKFRAFGWDTKDVNGHDIDALIAALKDARDIRAGRPKLIFAHTVKGKGVSFMEGQVGWHGKAPTEEQLEAALEELGI